MATATIFVDDAVRGTLPMVCARTGEPADYMVRSTRPVGGGVPGVAWLLLLLGPPGLLALVVVALLSSGREQLTVLIPRTEASYEHERQLRRFTWAALLLGLGCLALAVLFAQGFPLLFLALGAASLVAAAVLHGKVYFDDIDISLDGSRRWVTLSRVHPAFVREVNRQEAASRRP